MFILDTILKTLKAGGNVLLPVDTAGRVLELILILEDVSSGNRNDIFLNLVKNKNTTMIKIESWLKFQFWAENSLNYPIFFLTYVASSTIDYVKSFLEWMGDAITKSFETSRDNAFLLK